jgi:hypothetical protein
LCKKIINHEKNTKTQKNQKNIARVEIESIIEHKKKRLRIFWITIEGFKIEKKIL